MKIISEGVTKPPFWIGERVSCRHCGCVYVLEKGDSVCDGDGICASICPSCRKPNTIYADKTEKTCWRRT